MKRNRFLYRILAFLLFSTELQSQAFEKIKFQKDPSLIYFFQKGIKKDTLSKKSENLFYLLVADSLKKSVVVEVENGQLMLTANDSLFQLNYVPGLRYESFYIKRQNFTAPAIQEKAFQYQTLVDGVSTLSKERIRIILRDKMTGQIILENDFFIVY